MNLIDCDDHISITKGRCIYNQGEKPKSTLSDWSK